VLAWPAGALLPATPADSHPITWCITRGWLTDRCGQPGCPLIRSAPIPSLLGPLHADRRPGAGYAADRCCAARLPAKTTVTTSRWYDDT